MRTRALFALALVAELLVVLLRAPARRGGGAAPPEPALPYASPRAVTLGRDLDGDRDPDEIDLHLEVAEIQEELYPGRVKRFWVFAPEGQGCVRRPGCAEPDHPGGRCYHFAPMRPRTKV